MDLSTINIDLSSLTGSNLTGSNSTIIVGIFVTLVVMGITTLYDKFKSGDGNLAKTRESKLSLDLNRKIKDFTSKYMNNFSEFSTKLSSIIPKKVKKHNLENSELKSLKPMSGIPKIFGTIRSKISSFSSTLRSKKNKFGGGKSILQSNKKAGVSKPGGSERVSSFDIDKIVESKKDELDFDDDVLTEMSTAGSLKKNNATPLNADLSFDKDEFDIGFGEMNDESSEDDPLFNTGSEKIALADEHDNLLDSLKKDIVVKSEKKINFMSEMEGQDLDLKLIKSDLQDILLRLKKYKQRSNHN